MISEKVFKDLEKKSKETGIPMSRIVEDALAKYLETLQIITA